MREMEIFRERKEETAIPDPLVIRETVEWKECPACLACLDRREKPATLEETD